MTFYLPSSFSSPAFSDVPEFRNFIIIAINSSFDIVSKALFDIGESSAADSSSSSLSSVAFTGFDTVVIAGCDFILTVVFVSGTSVAGEFFNFCSADSTFSATMFDISGLFLHFSSTISSPSDAVELVVGVFFPSYSKFHHFFLRQ